MHIYARYLKILLFALLATVAAVAALCISVDPYGYFGVPRIQGFSAVKPASSTRNRTVKPRTAKRSGARTWILGNSRPELGLNPESQSWLEGNRPVFNLSMPGSDIREQASYGMLALDQPNTRAVYWGLDLVDFLDRRVAGPGCHRSATVSLPPSAADRSGLTALRDSALAIWSLRAVIDSLWTVASQHRVYVADRTELGFNPAKDFWFPIKGEGQALLFKLKNEEMRGRLVDRDLRLHAPGCNWSMDLELLLSTILAFKAKGVRTTLFINPYHQDYLDILHEAGLWPAFELWKRELTGLASNADATLWDFSGPGPGRDDSVAEVPRGGAMPWYWEPAHYRQELGELMIARMAGERPAGAPDFGVRLTP